ncbi:integrase catalytic domain-containing protein [Trichonephila clavipes]|uniref:Integrase catalytic domain-containing protein n=1 Tax=Trichonephila clavipes TaxID=2585209 RepID=A0A8X6V2B8_TRICX|nr:integrase catalytic domain-containing protein [Trichonephila clavipes]
MPNEIKLADYKFNIPGKIDVLLGAEIFYELLRPGQIYCGDSRLLLQNTVFGYVVSGSVGDEVRDNNIHCGLIRDSDLNTTLRPIDLLPFEQNSCLADVEKAFLQISLAPKDRDVVRFLIDDGENGVQVCRFNRVLFGVNASPFLLAATIKTHIGKYMEKYPVTVRTLDHCFYVDDLVTGEDDAKSAFDLSSKAAKIMSEAGMNLRKWISKDCELMKQWQLEHFDHLNMNDFVNHPHRVLGLLWHPQKTISVFV